MTPQAANTFSRQRTDAEHTANLDHDLPVRKVKNIDVAIDGIVEVHVFSRCAAENGLVTANSDKSPFRRGRNEIKCCTAGEK